MTKKRILFCKICNKETVFRVKRRGYKPHTGGRAKGGLKYTMEHCTRCNNRFYDGKVKKRVIPPKAPSHISIKENEL